MEANYIDLPTVLIYLFWIGFAGLIIYLRREDKRVGYPLESDRKGLAVQGYPAIPSPREPRAKHPALEGSSVAPHQQPTPTEAALSMAGGDAAKGLAYAIEQNGDTVPPAAPPPSAGPATHADPAPTTPEPGREAVPEPGPHHTDPTSHPDPDPFGEEPRS